jgi:hypothetical protein
MKIKTIYNAIYKCKSSENILESMLFNIVYGIIGICDGLVRILSLGYLGTSWDAKFLHWKSSREIKRRLK